MQSPKTLFAVLVSTILLAGLVIVGCAGGGSNSGGPQMGTVQSTISDPPTCSTSGSGEFQHVYITVTDVKINQSSTAGANDSGWQDLAPGLAASPKQIDLLGNPSNQCFLAQLGAQQILAGSYQQIRIILLANNQAGQLSTNACASVSAANCVVLGNGTVKALQLSSESQTGIKIPSGQIAGGQFVVPAGQTVDLNIDFDACASIVISGNGQYRLKPVLHAGEVSIQTNAATQIKGNVVDSISQGAIPGTTIVALEQRDSATTVDRVIMQTVADAQGNFVFCPVPDGTYDVVAVSIGVGGLAYAATVTTGVAQGSTLTNIPMVAETGINTTQASISGLVTTAGGSGGTAADITLAATQPLTIGGNNTLVIIPLVQQSSSTASLTTAAGGSCPAGTFCASYTVGVPAANPNVGPMNGPYTQDTVNPVNYTMDGVAFVPSQGATLDCSPSDQQVNTLSGGGALQVTAGNPFTAANVAFTGCQ